MLVSHVIFCMAVTCQVKLDFSMQVNQLGKWNSAKIIAVLKVNWKPFTTSCKSATIQDSYGHSKVVLPSGIAGTMLPWGAVSIAIHHYTESLLLVITIGLRICIYTLVPGYAHKAVLERREIHVKPCWEWTYLDFWVSEDQNWKENSSQEIAPTNWG